MLEQEDYYSYQYIILIYECLLSFHMLNQYSPQQISEVLKLTSLWVNTEDC